MKTREKLTKINDHITLIDDAGEATCYLVTGTDKALLIDTANGPIDLKTLCEKLTNLPITVVNTHGHCDHVFGNIWFQEAWLHPDDNQLHDEHFQFSSIQNIMKKQHKQPAKLLPLVIGQSFDLGGGLVLEVVPIKGHTAGSIGLLDRKDRILFSGDGINGHIWMQLKESQPLATLRASLLDIQAKYGDAFDYILNGHGKGLEPASEVDDLIEGCNELLAGQDQEDMPYTYSKNTCLQHCIGPNKEGRIVYAKEKL